MDWVMAVEEIVLAVVFFVGFGAVNGLNPVRLN